MCLLTWLRRETLTYISAEVQSVVKNKIHTTICVLHTEKKPHTYSRPILCYIIRLPVYRLVYTVHCTR